MSHSPESAEHHMADAAEDPDSRSLLLTNDHGITIDATYDDDAWEALLTPEMQAKMMAILGDAMAREGHRDVDIAVLFTNVERMAELNETHRQKSGPTDVLSFPADDDDFLGDIAIAYDVMAQQAAEMEISLADHCQHLLLHGALHLSGHDHLDDGEAEVMEALEIDILADHGIANPYASPNHPQSHTRSHNGGAS